MRPGLHAFGRDFGNGDLDRQVFQFAPDAPVLLRGKPGESLRHNLDEPTLDAIRIFGEPASAGSPGVVDALTRLAKRVPEDLAVVRFDPASGRDWIAALEVSHPAGWDPRQKIGKSFDAIHRPVAGGDPLRARASHYVRVMCGATAGLVRFGWGLQFDVDLDKTPGRPQAAFDPAAPRVLARVERQTMWGLCDGTAALFTIRTYLYDVTSLAADSRHDLAAAVASMSPEARTYKGLPADVGKLVAFVRHAPPTALRAITPL